MESYCTAAGRSLKDIERSYYASGLTAKTESEFLQTFERYYAEFRRSDETTEAFAQRVRTSSRSFIGTTDEVTEKIDKFSKLGVTYLIFYFPGKDQLRLMRLFAEQILPAFQDQ